MLSDMSIDEIDENTRAAILRLTVAERECLKRCLDHQTAKQMAIDLGISPHAVEKRLKMARAKLGLASSLEAARLLLGTEGCGQPGPQASDLAPAPEAANDTGPAGISLHVADRAVRRIRPVVLWGAV